MPSGQKTRIVYVDQVPFNFQKTTLPKPRTIWIHESDRVFYEAYLDKFRDQLIFHNQQIDDYYNSFKKN